MEFQYLLILSSFVTELSKFSPTNSIYYMDQINLSKQYYFQTFHNALANPFRTVILTASLSCSSCIVAVVCVVNRKLPLKYFFKIILPENSRSRQNKTVTGHAFHSFWTNFTLYKTLHRFFLAILGTGHKTARIASSKTVFRPF